jgi:glycosyltransferase involved in cell wall biosynthesis
MVMDTPLVTIITPTYNQERFVSACVESALAQRYANWEQIVVDDGSTDGTREVVASYRDPRVRLVALPHRGLGALAETYNAALAVSRGQLVGILEGDDLWPAGKLEHQVRAFADPRVVLSWGRAAIIDNDGREVGTRTSVFSREPQVRFSTAAAFRRLTRSNLFAPAVSVMLRRSALDLVGGFAQTGSDLFVDLPTWLRLTAILDGDVLFMDRVLGTYRVHAEQTTQLAGAAMTHQYLEVVLETVDSLDASVRARIGWTDTLCRRAIARGLLAEGEHLLGESRFGEASVAFRNAFAQCEGPADRMLALLGVVSAVLHLDLVRRAFATRASMLRGLRRD